MPIKNVKDVHRFLDSIPRFQLAGREAARFDLDRFRSFCSAIGNPQDQFPSIHVAGSNGKGSTCHILGSVYLRSGLRVGVYTSPHIISFNERFTVNGGMITDEQLLRFFRKYEERIRTFSLSYFEISTAIAFWYFAVEKVDIGIIEVGLGGRLDATNVIMPEVSVITNISRDHTDILGETIAQIAREKAGIIKERTPVVLGNVAEPARRIIEEIAEAKDAPLKLAESLEPEFDNGRFLLHAGERSIRFETGMGNPVQAYNIAVAWQVREQLNSRFPLADEEFSRGVAEVTEVYGSKARFEKLKDGLRWYFDGAHNVDAVKALKKATSTVGPVSDAILVLSMMKDKATPEVLNEFLEFKKILYHGMDSPRAAGMQYITKELPGAEEFPADKKDQELLFGQFKSELVIFAGSFYFYRTVRDWLTSFTNNR